MLVSRPTMVFATKKLHFSGSRNIYLASTGIPIKSRRLARALVEVGSLSLNLSSKLMLTREQYRRHCNYKLKRVFFTASLTWQELPFC